MVSATRRKSPWPTAPLGNGAQAEHGRRWVGLGLGGGLRCAGGGGAALGVVAGTWTMAWLVLLAICLPGLALGVDLEPGASSRQGGMPDTNEMLWNGARWGNVKMVRDALAAGAYIDEKDPECASSALALRQPPT